jgi:hypothetical protein
MYFIPGKRTVDCHDRYYLRGIKTYGRQDRQQPLHFFLADAAFFFSFSLPAW